MVHNIVVRFCSGGYGRTPSYSPFPLPQYFFFGFLSPPSFYLSSANHVLPFIAWRVSLGLNWLYAFSLVLFVFSEGNRAHEANTLSRQAIHTPSRCLFVHGDGGRWCWLTCSRWRHGGDGVCGAQQLVCILWSVSKAIVCVLAPRWEHMYMSALLSLFGSESRRVS